MAELAIRLAFSLAVVVGLLLAVLKVGARRFQGRSGAAVRVVHRQPLSRTSSVAVVEIGSRVLVLGTTEHQVNVLTELDPGELEIDRTQDSADDEGAEVIEFDTLGGQPPEAPMAPMAPTVAGKRRREVPAQKSTTPSATASATGSGPLSGSVLSPQTWKQAVAAVSGRGHEQAS